MKYKILPFIVGIMLAGCNDKHGSGEQTVAGTDSLSKSVKSASLMDSVHDDNFKKLLADDSIELIQVNHFMADTEHGEEILYLDKRASNSYKEKKQYESIKEGLQAWNSQFTDSLVHIRNPFPDMNGTYVHVGKFHGYYVVLSLGDESERIPLVMDTSIFICQMMSVNCPYISAERKNTNVITYHYMERQNPMSIEIKNLGGEYGLQLWEGFGRGKYELRVPVEKVGDMPELVYNNNIGLGAGNGFDIHFDPINYDSLMNSK